MVNAAGDAGPFMRASTRTVQTRAQREYKCRDPDAQVDPRCRRLILAGYSNRVVCDASARQRDQHENRHDDDHGDRDRSSPQVERQGKPRACS